MTKEDRMLFDLILAELKDMKAAKEEKTKSESTFDREKYLSIAKELDALCQNGKPLKAVRPVIYAIMDGKETMDFGKKFVEYIKAGFKN